MLDWSAEWGRQEAWQRGCAGWFRRNGLAGERGAERIQSTRLDVEY